MTIPTAILALLTDAALERARRAAEASFERGDIVLGKLGLVAEEHLAEVECTPSDRARHRPCDCVSPTPRSAAGWRRF